MIKTTKLMDEYLDSELEKIRANKFDDVDIVLLDEHVEPVEVIGRYPMRKTALMHHRWDIIKRALEQIQIITGKEVKVPFFRLEEGKFDSSLYDSGFLVSL